MGFFTSRKEDNHTSTGVGGKKEDKSMVQVLRSRFYSRKGKEREKFQFSYHNVSSPSNPVASSPLTASKRSTRNSTSGPSIIRNTPERSHSIIAPTERRSYSNSLGQSPKDGRTSKPLGSSPLAQQASASSPSISRKSTDVVTVTLAQRLNELASANSEGLLSEDEYRLLRQNLFERFSSNVIVPTEASVVPATPPKPSPLKGGVTPERPTSRPLSNFQVERPLSTMSKSSTTSGANGLFRRATDRRPTSNDNETSSLLSAKSNTSLFKIPKMLSKRASDTSIRTAASRHADGISVSSRRLSSDKGHSDHLTAPSTPRSAAGSIRRMQVPPSSFNARLITQERDSAIYNIFDEDHLSTVADIQQEIQNVETEQKRLMDAFNGLEVTTLSRSQRHRITLPSPFNKSNNIADSIWGDSDGRSQGRMNLTDDGVSMRSGTSVGTSPSLARSVYSSQKGLRAKGSLTSPMAVPHPPLPLLRKVSLTSVNDRKISPLPAINPISQGYLHTASSSNISLLSRSSRIAVNTPEEEKTMTTFPVDDSQAMEAEFENIRRRREEVSHRYEARLEYLRAKLKGALLHEKLMRR